jgi:hypothetical protein
MSRLSLSILKARGYDVPGLSAFTYRELWSLRKVVDVLAEPSRLALL